MMTFEELKTKVEKEIWQAAWQACINTIHQNSFKDEDGFSVVGWTAIERVRHMQEEIRVPILLSREPWTRELWKGLKNHENNS